MRSPADMTIVQLELSNACERKCGGCTRGVPHVRKPFMMSPKQFERGVESMRGWEAPGKVLGVMGGNPVLNPHFARISEWFADNWGGPRTGLGRGPLHNLGAYAAQRNLDPSSGRGLWSNLGPKFYEHLELIHDVYSYWVVNDHRNEGLHQALFIPSPR